MAPPCPVARTPDTTQRGCRPQRTEGGLRVGGGWARPEEGQGKQAAHLAQSTDAGPCGGLGPPLDTTDPGKRRVGAWIKTGSKDCGRLSLSASPGVPSAQGIHTAPPPITQPGVSTCQSSAR